ncbi:MAG: Cof-type HAD-IIB family hydrolase [Ruminococcus sp.]|nr:Cof-type HAD-IIB family hydrolase [Ruminococcus sp.]
MKSVIFFDIDGTLVSEDGLFTIPESTRTAIEMTRSKGNLTFINTGRTEFNVNKKVRQLGFDGLICGCGTYIEYNGEILLYNKLSKDFCLETTEILRKCGVTPVYEHKDGYFFDDKAPQIPDLDDFLENFVDECIDISRRVENADFVFDKFVVWESRFSDMELFRREISKNFDIIDRGHGFYENVPLGFSKATAIKLILDKLNIPIENAYAIGDSRNDLPMLKAVPNSIAMGGAEVIYPYVSYITTSLADDGIYNALEYYNLI